MRECVAGSQGPVFVFSSGQGYIGMSGQVRAGRTGLLSALWLPLTCIGWALQAGPGRVAGVRAAWWRACATMLLTLTIAAGSYEHRQAGQGARSARMAAPEAPLRRLPGSKIIGVARGGSNPGGAGAGWGGWRV